MRRILAAMSGHATRVWNRACRSPLASRRSCVCRDASSSLADSRCCLIPQEMMNDAYWSAADSFDAMFERYYATHAEEFDPPA
jgi:hypothetical protein